MKGEPISMAYWKVYEDTFQYSHVWLYINKLIKDGKYDEYLTKGGLLDAS